MEFSGTIQEFMKRGARSQKFPSIKEILERNKWFEIFVTSGFHLIDTDPDASVSTRLTTDERNANWVEKVPVDIRTNAFKDAWQTFIAARELLNNEEIFASMKFRCKKASHSITLPKKTIKKDTFYISYMGNNINRKKEKGEMISLESDGDTRISFERRKGFYFHKLIKTDIVSTPVPSVISSEKQRTVIALDPGVRTFLTGYEPTKVVDMASGSVRRLFKLRNVQNRLRHSMKFVKARQRKRYRIACERIAKRIKNLVDEIHWKCINYLLTYDDIILPEFKVKQMIKKKKVPGKGINRRTKREMVSLSHYKFKMRLISKLVAFPNKKLYIVNESYTSKTCTNCGHINENLGGNKLYFCKDGCKHEIPRDYNGARNIFIKYCSVNEYPYCDDEFGGSRVINPQIDLFEGSPAFISAANWWDSPDDESCIFT